MATAKATRPRDSLGAAAAAVALRVTGFCAERRRPYQPPTWNRTSMATSAAAENHTMLCWPAGTTMKAFADALGLAGEAPPIPFPLLVEA